MQVWIGTYRMYVLLARVFESYVWIKGSELIILCILGCKRNRIKHNSCHQNTTKM